MHSLTALNVVRRDPSSGASFVATPAPLLADLQADPQTSQKLPIELPDGAFRSYTAYFLTLPLPDIRLNDQLFAVPATVDGPPAGVVPNVYSVVDVAPWPGSHLEVSLRRPLAPFDAVTIYAPDETRPVSTTAMLTNLKSLNSRRNVSDYFSVLLPLGTAVAPGQLVSDGPNWYVVEKVGDNLPAALGVEAMALPLPLVLTGQRVTASGAGGTLNGYGDPRSQAQVTTTALTLRAGISNQVEPLTQQDMGVVPRGVDTLYVPLGADIQKDDHLTLPSGQTAYVQQVNQDFANGYPYCLQVMLDDSAGQGISLLPTM